MNTATGLEAPAGRASSLPIRALMLGGLISSIGNQITALAVPWFVLETTGSASKTGLAAAAAMIPLILSVFFGGTVVDRMQQKHLSIFSDLMSCLTVAAVPLLYHTIGLNFITLLALMFLGAIFDGPGNTARQAMIPALAERAGQSLEKVNSGFATISAITALAGAPLAGLLVAVFGAANVLWFDAVTFLVSGLLILAFVPLAAVPEPSGESFLNDMKEGFTYLMRQRGLRAIMFTATVINFLISPLFGVVIPYFANTIYQSASQLGFMMGGLGLGSLLGAVAYGQFGSNWSRRWAIVATMILFTVPIWGMTLLPPLLAMIALLFLIGFGSGMVNPMVFTMVQQQTPAHLLGRVMGTFGATAMMAGPLGLLLGGSSISTIGLTATIAVMAAIISLTTISTLVNPAFHEFDSPQPGPAVVPTP
jgi:MFS family permease